MDKIVTECFLIACLLYGSGLRLMEAVRLHVQDIDVDYTCIRAWNVKGGKHRAVTLAAKLIPLLRDQIAKAERFLTLDLRDDRYNGGWMPTALRHKNP